MKKMLFFLIYFDFNKIFIKILLKKYQFTYSFLFFNKY